MNASEIHAARRRLGLSIEAFAAVLRVTGRTVRRWEDGSRDIPGPAIVLTELLLACREARVFLGVVDLE